MQKYVKLKSCKETKGAVIYMKENEGVFMWKIGETKITAVTEPGLLADEQEIKNIFIRISRLAEEEEKMKNTNVQE